MAIDIRNLSAGYVPGITAFYGVSLTINEAETWAVIGRNGSGKSTFVKCLAGLISPRGGTITIGGKLLGAYSAKELARVIAYVPQANDRVLPPYTVSDYVLLGRFPYQGFMALSSANDLGIVYEALSITDTDHLARRPMNELSGGEVQRVFLAGAVAQRTPVLLLDEPATFLDPLHQEQLSRILKRIHSEYQTSVVMVTHDINRALGECSHILAFLDGNPLYAGSSSKFSGQCPAVLKDLFDVSFEKAAVPHSGRTVMVPEDHP